MEQGTRTSRLHAGVIPHCSQPANWLLTSQAPSHCPAQLQRDVSLPVSTFPLRTSLGQVAGRRWPFSMVLHWLLVAILAPVGK